MTFDAKRKRIYITGDGATSVFEQRDADHYEHLVDVPTGFRAKTSLYVPELNRFYTHDCRLLGSRVLYPLRYGRVLVSRNAALT